ncbi:helix-turn-helix transcriptional regulator [Streptomyces sp. NBC_01485]|uniref:helix-turn-helix domain-containing protein n=1 Tax=Streptomyces sp. NBC_01485 TaxID=2903884 RepID=UPI002E38153A|nr:helix-turn-helix transcriptional regulator [Streptomyces sp. NBC_01485]
MTKPRAPRTQREKYGEELRLRRIAAGLTQEELADQVFCSPTLISHFEAGRRLPRQADARLIDRALGTDGFFLRWLEELENRYARHFSAVAELERKAVMIQQFAPTLIPGIYQTPDYARAVFRAYRPNYTTEEIDREVVIRTERADVVNGSSRPVLWTLLDEAVLRRPVGGPKVMAEQLWKMADLAEEGRVRLHVLPYRIGAYAIQEGLLTLMSFEKAATVAYMEGFGIGQLVKGRARVSECQTAYELVLGEALPQQESLAFVKSVAEEHAHDQQ